MCVSRDDFPDTKPVTSIEVDSTVGSLIGLTSDVFVPISQKCASYPIGTQLFRSGDSIYIQAVEIWEDARNKGHFNRLLNTLWHLGFTIKVPNPVAAMIQVLNAKGFDKIDETHPDSSELDVVMVKAP